MILFFVIFATFSSWTNCGSRPLRGKPNERAKEKKRPENGMEVNSGSAYHSRTIRRLVTLNLTNQFLGTKFCRSLYTSRVRGEKNLAPKNLNHSDKMAALPIFRKKN